MAACTSIGKKRQSGFAYMALLVVITASLFALSAAIPDIYQQAKREREAQLLFVGQQYANAIRHFYNNPNANLKRYPESLEELLVDNRTQKPMHHLRQLYRDPMTDSFKWGLVQNEEEEIMGVYSLSEGKILRTNYQGYPDVLVGGDRYKDIKFVYLHK